MVLTIVTCRKFWEGFLLKSCSMKHLAVLLVVSAAGFAQQRQVTPIPNPSAPGSIQPNWSTTADGAVLLSWVEPQKDAYALRYAVRRGSAWSEARTIVANR